MNTQPIDAGDVLAAGVIIAVIAFVVLAAIAASALERDAREAMQLGISRKTARPLEMPHFQRRNAARDALEAHKKGVPRICEICGAAHPQGPFEKKIILRGGQPVGCPPNESEGK
jgi:hypothetical protein